MGKPPELQHIEEVFSEALATAPAERHAFLEASCADDNVLREKVERLLAAHEHAGEFLASPTEVTDLAATLPPTTPPAMPDHIGHYRIKRVIATGGMGVVYEAIQEQPHRTVALKVLKAGIASPSALRRFGYESEILARLRHPNIAQVYEAGAHDGGGGAVPFFAMEYIPNARSLVEHANEKDLNTRARLKLFAKVCHAVHHGHQKGIIHRDLKPGNILVDSGGEPKIIDFGVARATDSDMAITTLQTEVGQLIGTLQYMSPEQCEADPHDLDSRSDVYALGVVLYELLCGQLPYDLANLAVPEAARVIRDESPTNPSTINRTLRGDVETIVLKALEKERARRYSSAHELASDIERYLNDQPIIARPPSVRYQMAKFARRNKTLVGGVIVAFVALTLGATVATWQAVRAQAAASRAIATKEFLADVLGATDFVEAGRQLTVKEILDEAVDRIEVRFADQPEIEAEVLHIIGRSYATMSDFDESIELLRSALNIRKRTLGEEHRDTLESAHSLGVILLADRRLAEAEELLRWTAETRGRTLGEDHADTLRSIARLSMVVAFRGKLDQAEALGRRAVDGLARVLGNEHRSTLEARWNLSTALGWNGKRREAIALATENLEIARRTLGPEHSRTIEFANSLGTWLTKEGRWEEAQPLLRWSLETRQRLRGKDDYESLRWMEFFGWSLHRNGNTAEGEPLLREAVERLRRTLGRHLTTAYAMVRLGALEQDLGNLEDAEDLVQQCVDIQRDVLGDEHRDTLNSIDTLASILVERGRHDDAESLWRGQVAVERRKLGENHPTTLQAMSRFGWFLAGPAVQELDEAEATLRETLDKQREHVGRERRPTLVTMQRLGLVLAQRGAFAEAESLLRETLDGRRRVLGEDHRDTIWSRLELARALNTQAKFDQAEPHFREAVEGRRRALGPRHRDTLNLMNEFAWLLKDHGPEKLAQAEPLARQATELCRSALGDDDEQTLMTADTLAVVLHLRGKNEEAIVEFDDVVAAARKAAGDERWFTAMSSVYYGRCLLELERFEEAESVLLIVYNGGNESALEALIELYDASGKPEKAAEYRALLREAEEADAP